MISQELCLIPTKSVMTMFGFLFAVCRSFSQSLTTVLLLLAMAESRLEKARNMIVFQSGVRIPCDMNNIFPSLSSSLVSRNCLSVLVLAVSGQGVGQKFLPHNKESVSESILVFLSSSYFLSQIDGYIRIRRAPLVSRLARLILLMSWLQVQSMPLNKVPRRSISFSWSLSSNS